MTSLKDRREWIEFEIKAIKRECSGLYLRMIQSDGFTSQDSAKYSFLKEQLADLSSDLEILNDLISQNEDL